PDSYMDMLIHWIYGEPQQKENESRSETASEIIRELQEKLDAVEGITLYMQPVQDLTVEDRVSRTQYQYSLEDPDAKELGAFVPKFVEKLQTIPGRTRQV